MFEFQDLNLNTHAANWREEKSGVLKRETERLGGISEHCSR